MQIIIVMCMQVSRDYVVDLDVGISIIAPSESTVVLSM